MTLAVNDNKLFEVREAEILPKDKALAGEYRTFRKYDPNQDFFMPPSINDWLPKDHEARFISEAVDELLDLEPIYSSYKASDGAPPYNPAMMLKLLLWAYSTGVTSSREIERRTTTDIAFRYITANQSPDYRSISRFRRRHFGALDNLFFQVLTLCSKAGLVKLGRVALDGTKLKAATSRHKAMSYDRLNPAISKLEEEVKTILKEADEIDELEDKKFGKDKRGDEIPEELRKKETRLAKLREAKESIEAEAREKAAKKVSEKASNKHLNNDQAEKALTTEQAVPDKKAQRNFTDPESRMMKTSDSFQYCYNAQAVVDETSQVILATNVTQVANDFNQLVPMINKASENLSAIGIDNKPEVLLADAGYCSNENLEKLSDISKTNGTKFLIATGRMKHGEKIPKDSNEPISQDATLKEQMAYELRTETGQNHYKRRKAIVEPVFGQMKVRQKAGQLRLRGLKSATSEWTLHAICHNLRKLAKTVQLNYSTA